MNSANVYTQRHETNQTKHETNAYILKCRLFYAGEKSALDFGTTAE